MNPGDIVYHKATGKRCVIARDWDEGRVSVTTEDGESKIFNKVELWTEEEWLKRNKK